MPKAVCRRILLGLVLGLAAATGAAAQTATVRGFVTAAADREPLPGVNVVALREGVLLRGAITDGDGVYVLGGLPAGRVVVRASFVGFATQTDTLDLRAGEIRILNLTLAGAEAELGEIVVEDEGEGGAARLSGGLQSIRPKDLELVPVPDVSGDLAAYLTTLPGVVTLGDRGGQFFVRGGEPSHNLVLLDGMYVHQPFHLLGFYSAFPADIIQRADVYLGGFGAPYSGRIASVIDVYARNGNKRRFAGAASAAPFVSAVRLEGPLMAERVSFLASVRQSVIEDVAARYVAQDLPFRFDDAFGKVHAVLNANHQLSVTALRTHDRGRLGAASAERLDEIRWTNEAVGLRYLVLPRRVPFVAEILLSWSRLYAEVGPDDAPVRWTEFDGLNYAVNMTDFIGGNEWKWGLFWRVPEITTLLGGLFQNVEFGTSRRHKAGVYLEPDLRLTETLRLRVGVIAQLFPGQENTAFVEPRARLLWQRGRHEATAAAGLHHQEVFGLNDRRDATNVFTAWRSAPTDRLARAVHVLAGYRTAPTGWLDLAAEVYYKRLSDLYVAEWTAFPRFTTRLQRASGRVAGLDLRAEVRRARFYAALTYGLSSVRYEAQQEAIALWYGTETLAFHPPHDRRHQLDLRVAGAVREVELSLRWNLGSGRPFSRLFGFDGFVLMNGAVDLFDTADEQRVIYERPFQARLPAYHRLDVSAERRFAFDGFSLTVQGGVINVYDRRNLFALDLFTLRRSDQLPVLPTLGLKVEVP